MAMKTAEIKLDVLKYHILYHSSPVLDTLKGPAKRYKYPTSKEINSELSPNAAAVFITCSVYGRGIIWVSEEYVEPSIIAHEAVHAAKDIMAHVNSECEELQAYIVEYLVKTILSL